MGSSKGMKKTGVVLDTSILLLAYEGVPVLDEIEELLETKPECLVPIQVVKELDKLQASTQLHKRNAARLALSIVKKYCRIVEAKGDNADEAIIELVKNHSNLIPVTADNELRRKLRDLGKANIYYRRSKHGLMIEGDY